MGTCQHHQHSDSRLLQLNQEFIAYNAIKRCWMRAGPILLRLVLLDKNHVARTENCPGALFN